MQNPKRIAFIVSDMYPFLPEEDAIRMRNRVLPELFVQQGWEARMFLPRWGEVNERKHQLHEVIRLSGQNIVIGENDHPILLKVSNVLPIRMQVYFVDNEEFFSRRRGWHAHIDKDPDNDERCIFFCRSVLETIKRQCWEPDIIYCSGWIAALIPLYLRKCYTSVPFMDKAKIVVALDDQEYKNPFPTSFGEKLLIPGLTHTDVRDWNGFNVDYELLMRQAVDNADAVIEATEGVNPRLTALAQTKDKPLLNYNEENQTILDFCQSMLPANEL